jgi:hypothetical protein
MVSIMNSISLPVISQKPKLKSLFISHHDPNIWPQILKSFARALENNLNIYTKLKKSNVIRTHLFMCVSPKTMFPCKPQCILVKWWINCTVLREA